MGGDFFLISEKGAILLMSLGNPDIDWFCRPQELPV